MQYFSSEDSLSSSGRSCDSYEELMSFRSYESSQRIIVPSVTTSSSSPSRPLLSPETSTPSLVRATKVSSINSFTEGTYGQSSFIRNTNIKLAVAEEPVKQAVPPNWCSLLFGGNKEVECDEILSVPDHDTYYEDCKLAEDVALNTVNNYDLPVINGLREINSNRIVSALRALQKSKQIKRHLCSKEKALSYILLLDYLSCCCQEGNLLSLYNKCNDKKKNYHLDLISRGFDQALESFDRDNYSVEQLHSAEKLISASIDRIPERLLHSLSCVKTCIKQKISALESRGAKINHSMYCENTGGHKSKVSKTSEQSQDFSLGKSKPKIAHSTPAKFDMTRDWTFSSTSSSALQSVTTKVAKGSHFLDSLFSSENEMSESIQYSSLNEQSSPNDLPSRSRESFTTESSKYHLPSSRNANNSFDDDFFPDIPILIPKTSLKEQEVNENTDANSVANVQPAKSPSRVASNPLKYSNYRTPINSLSQVHPNRAVMKAHKYKSPGYKTSMQKLSRYETAVPIDSSVQEAGSAINVKGKDKILKSEEVKLLRKTCKCSVCFMKNFLQGGRRS